MECKPTPDASRPPRCRDKMRPPCRRPVLPERVTKSDARSCFPTHIDQDPSTTLMLLQMVADSYEDSRLVWEANKDRKRKKRDDPALYGPINAGQRKIEQYLVSCRFLSRPPPPDPEPEPEPLPPPKDLARLPCWDQTRNQSICDVQQQKNRMKAKQLLCFLQKHLKLAEKCEAQPRPFTLPTQAVVRRPLPARPALPRIVPSCKPRLRRMTSADTRALIACSVRKSRIRRPVARRVPEIHVAPELRVSGFRDVDYDDLRTLVWPQPKKPATEPPPVLQEQPPIAERPPPPLYISLIVYGLLHLLMFSIMTGITLWALWTACATVIGCIFGVLSFVASLFLPSTDSDVDYDA
ncbi:hypothetical protein LshimejAT787_1602350 [Lyophyllum shimeji]|uniref:Uncharacterized protein n=1 Tax=Lyophyllum shimeji TaxID=47721 RepID=A0A9P3UU33_LYOSH|nr:hypothetical protein LshimejAT787_1602350 [Lyophyllum shimeji]